MLIPWSPQSAKIATKSNRDWVLNAKPVLLLHFDGADEAVTTKDSGVTGHTITFGGTAQLDTAQKKFGSSSLLLDGNSDYLTIADHANWDISTNWTLDFWARHASISDDLQVYVEQYEDGLNFWQLGVERQTLTFKIVTANSAVVLVSGTGTIAASIWYRIAVCKLANEYGIYINGAQDAYTSDADTDSYAGLLNIGRHGDASGYLNGWLDEIRIVQGNPFGAAPVVGKTDTINVPFKPYISWR